jgi:stress response protein SCP2
MDFKKVPVGTTLNFAKDFEENVSSSTVTFNLDWGMKNGRAVDLDAILLAENRSGLRESATVPASNPGFLSRLFGAKATPAKVTHYKSVGESLVYYGDLNKQGIRHHGDDLTGASLSGEYIEIDLDNLPQNTTHLTFAILSFSGDRFCDLPFAKIKIFKGTPNHMQGGMLDHELTQFQSSTRTIVMAQMVKNEQGEWELTTLSKESTASTVRKVADECRGA